MKRAKVTKAIVDIDSAGLIIQSCHFFNCLFRLHGFDERVNIANHVSQHTVDCKFTNCSFEYVPAKRLPHENLNP